MTGTSIRSWSTETDAMEVCVSLLPCGTVNLGVVLFGLLLVCIKELNGSFRNLGFEN